MVQLRKPPSIPRPCRIEAARFVIAAVFGAKVLHPATVLPAVQKNIPVYILNSRNPSCEGTRIAARAPHCKNFFKAIAAKKRITIVDDRQEPRGDWTVRTKIVRHGSDDIAVDYRLRETDGTWKIIDVTIEGLSLASNYRSRSRSRSRSPRPPRSLPPSATYGSSASSRARLTARAIWLW